MAAQGGKDVSARTGVGPGAKGDRLGRFAAAADSSPDPAAARPCVRPPDGRGSRLTRAQRYTMFPILAASQDPALVGEKAANLARLAEVGGSAIPPYFVVATPVFDAVMVQPGPSHRGPGGGTAGQRGATPTGTGPPGAHPRGRSARGAGGDHRQFLPGVQPAPRGRGRPGQRAQLGHRRGRYRSASFAGQYTTCLNVQGAAALVRAIRRVWASTWSVQALRYRKRHWASQAPVQHGGDRSADGRCRQRRAPSIPWTRRPASR